MCDACFRLATASGPSKEGGREGGREGGGEGGRV